MYAVITLFVLIIYSAHAFGHGGFPHGFNQGWNPFPGDQNPAGGFKPNKFGFGGQGQQTGLPQTEFGRPPQQGFGPQPGQVPNGGQIQGFPNFFGPNFGQTTPAVPSDAGQASVETPLSDDEMKLVLEIFTPPPPAPVPAEVSTSLPAPAPLPAEDDTTFPDDCEACYDIDRRVQDQTK